MATPDKQTAGTKAHIYNLIIIDESGSMSSLTQATINGVNGTIQSIRDAQAKHADTQEHYLTLVTFDTTSYRPPVRILIDRQPITAVTEFKNYSPQGCTPLYDAVGISLTELHKAIAGDPDASGVVTIVTDGYENDSTEWDLAAVSALIKRLTDEGWSFSYMGADHDVKSVAFSLNITNTVEFAHDEQGTGASWARETSARSNYYDSMANIYCRMQSKPLSLGEKRSLRRSLNEQYYTERVTPGLVKSLKQGEVFVFGSNGRGIHDGGAAAVALRKFGAVMGQSDGPQGQSYAIPTTATRAILEQAVARFTDYAKQHPELHFYVTEIGCGNAGYTPADIAPMFRDCISLENVSLPESFWDVLGLKM